MRETKRHKTISVDEVEISDPNSKIEVSTDYPIRHMDNLKIKIHDIKSKDLQDKNQK